MTEADRDWFDALVEEAIESLPPALRDLIEEVPVIVLDRPTPEMLQELGAGPDADPLDFCGLHTGVALTERSVEAPTRLPSDIHLFREGIIAQARRTAEGDLEDAVFDEIVVTLLHEIGHHFGLSEEDLADLGYD